MREFRIAYSEYEQQMHIANQDGRARVLARGRELQDYATQMMVVDESTMASPGSTSPKRTSCNGSKFVYCVDVKQTSDADVCR